MEVVEDIVIVGAGIAGLSTSLGLHRYFTNSLFSLHPFHLMLQLLYIELTLTYPISCLIWFQYFIRIIICVLKDGRLGRLDGV